MAESSIIRLSLWTQLRFVLRRNTSSPEVVEKAGSTAQEISPMKKTMALAFAGILLGTSAAFAAGASGGGTSGGSAGGGVGAGTATGVGSSAGSTGTGVGSSTNGGSNYNPGATRPNVPTPSLSEGAGTGAGTGSSGTGTGNNAAMPGQESTPGTPATPGTNNSMSPDTSSPLTQPQSGGSAQ
jgi:hypothetical protein